MKLILALVGSITLVTAIGQDSATLRAATLAQMLADACPPADYSDAAAFQACGRVPGLRPRA
jgi:hypothetical protein